MDLQDQRNVNPFVVNPPINIFYDNNNNMNSARTLINDNDHENDEANFLKDELKTAKYDNSLCGTMYTKIL